MYGRKTQQQRGINDRLPGFFALLSSFSPAMGFVSLGFPSLEASSSFSFLSPLLGTGMSRLPGTFFAPPNKPTGRLAKPRCSLCFLLHPKRFLRLKLPSSVSSLGLLLRGYTQSWAVVFPLVRCWGNIEGLHASRWVPILGDWRPCFGMGLEIERELQGCACHIRKPFKA